MLHPRKIKNVMKNVIMVLCDVPYYSFFSNPRQIILFKNIFIALIKT